MKGISPFVAIILVVATVIVIGGMVSIWLTTLTQTQTERVGNQTEEQIECGYGGIRIDDSTIQCDVTGASDKLNFTLENTGTIDMYHFSGQIYLGGLVYTYSVYNPLTNLEFNSTSPIRQGESKTVVVNITDDLANSTDPTWIRIVTTKCPTVDDKVENVDCT